MKIKREMNALDLMCVVRELKADFDSAYFVNVYQISPSHFIFKLRQRDKGSLNLIFEVGRRFHLTNFEYEKPSLISSFCRFMRKNFNRSKIIELSQYDFDRIIQLTVSSRSMGELSLVLELVREGNLLVIDASKKILSVLKPARMRDRDLIPSVSYKYPPMRGVNPLTCSSSVLKDQLSSMSMGIVQALTRAMNLPGEVAEEICFRAGIEKSSKAYSLEFSDVERILEVFHEMLDDVESLNLSPQIVYHEGRIFTVIPFDFRIYDDFEKEYYDSFNNAVDIYFHKLSLLEEEELRSKVKLEVEAKFKAVISKQLKHYRELSEKASRYRRWAELVMKNLNLIQMAIDNIHKLNRMGFSWSEISNRLDELIESPVRSLCSSFNPKDKILNITVDGQVIPLDVNLSAAANASQFFDRSKKFHRRAVNAERAVEELKLKIKDEVEECLRKRIVKPLKITGIVRRKKWYENFRWFISSNGFLVVGGRDASQNESLVRKRLNENDIFVHAEIHGAPAVIIKSEGKEVPNETIWEAAQFAVSYSKAWTAGLEAASAFWVYGNQVSKTPPSGEYLARGAFMIYGKRNYLKNIPLRLSIGFDFVNDYLRLIAGPPSAIKRITEYYVLLAPGEIPRDEAAKRIKAILIDLVESSLKEGLKKLSTSMILELLPKGGFRFL